LLQAKSVVTGIRVIANVSIISYLTSHDPKILRKYYSGDIAVQNKSSLNEA